MSKPTFKWADPFLLEDQLTEEEKMVRDSARNFCQDRLMTRVLEANRHETFDRNIFYEMGEMGLLGSKYFTDNSLVEISNIKSMFNSSNCSRE